MSKFEPCGHLFHASCIVTWMKHKNTCPVCRTRVCARVSCLKSRCLQVLWVVCELQWQASAL